MRVRRCVLLLLALVAAASLATIVAIAVQHSRAPRPPDGAATFPATGGWPPNDLTQMGRQRQHAASAASVSSRDAPLRRESTRLLSVNYSAVTLDDLVGPRWNEEAADGGVAVCELMLLGSEQCELRFGLESAAQCIRRHGFENWDRVMPRKCRESEVWRQLAKKEKEGVRTQSRTSGESPGELRWASFAHLRDRVTQLQFVEATKKRSRDDPAGQWKARYVPPTERRVAEFGPPRRCSKQGTVVRPISFAVPDGNVVPHVTRNKLFPFLPYTPRPYPPGQSAPQPSRLGPQDEYLASLLQQHSYFAFTHKRGGWDCLRHTEMLSNGAVPYWADIDGCGRFCMTAMPKALLREALILPGVAHIGRIPTTPRERALAMLPRRRGGNESPYFTSPRDGHVNFKRPGDINFQEFDAARYFSLADRLLNHTWHHLTTSALASYVLRAIGHEEPRHVLLVQPAHQDFMTLSVESGLSELGILWSTTVNELEGTPPRHSRTRVEVGSVSVGSLAANFSAAEFENERTRRGINIELHGVGHVFGLRLRRPPQREFIPERGIRAALLSGVFDLVIYSTFAPLADLPLMAEVKAARIPPSRVVIIDGADDRDEPEAETRQLLDAGFHLFRREMHDHAQC